MEMYFSKRSRGSSTATVDQEPQLLEIRNNMIVDRNSNEVEIDKNEIFDDSGL